MIDGVLDEPVWRQAAMLTGFSQFSPLDGIAAADSTEVLLWYSPTALYVGIRAYERHGAVHATLADRDKISADDNVQILLGTFHDQRQAYVFAVNPFGVQMDGTIVESGQVMGGGWTPTLSGRVAPDLSQDFVFTSKGRLTDYGYEVELRIPFKSLKFQSADAQSWDINVVRQVQHSGFEDSWAPAKRANASFLGQAGTLDGLGGIDRGLVLDLNPVRHAQGDRRAGTERLGVRASSAAVRRQRALGHDEQPHAQRHRPSRLRRSGVGRRTVRDRSAAIADLSREAAVLSRRPRAVHRAAQPDLHAPDRQARGSAQAHRQGRRNERRLPVRR